MSSFVRWSDRRLLLGCHCRYKCSAQFTPRIGGWVFICVYLAQQLHMPLCLILWSSSNICAIGLGPQMTLRPEQRSDLLRVPSPVGGRSRNHSRPVDSLAFAAQHITGDTHKWLTTNPRSYGRRNRERGLGNYSQEGTGSPRASRKDKPPSPVPATCTVPQFGSDSGHVRLQPGFNVARHTS